MTEDKYKEIHGKVLLGDGDIFCYRSAAVAERMHYLVLTGDNNAITRTYFEAANEAKSFAKSSNGEVWSKKDDLGEEFAIEALRTSINQVLDKLKPSNYEFYLSGPKNFRKEVDSGYKESRGYLPKPKYLRHCRNYLKEEYGAKESGVGEADDAIGIRANELMRGCIIASIDKDLLQIPGWHYDWVKDILFEQGRKEAAFAFYQQVLTGDSTDDIKGIPGIGPVGARRILEGGESPNDLFKRVWDTYRDRYGKDDIVKAWDEMIKQASLVKILKDKSPHTDYYWKPPFIPQEVLECLGKKEG